MSRQITKEYAIKIVKKLKAIALPGKAKAHDDYAVEEDGIHIGIISIRRASEKDKGHDYVPKSIHYSTHDAKMLAKCPMSRESYIEKLRENGVLPRIEASEEGPTSQAGPPVRKDHQEPPAPA